jgi:hypothetical protein
VEIQAQIFGEGSGISRPPMGPMSNPFGPQHPRDIFDEVEATFFGGK